MTELREFFPAVKKLSDMGGTFCVDSHGHSAEVWASWEYVPEAQEEENRVSGAGRDDAPERWFIPAPDSTLQLVTAIGVLILLKRVRRRQRYGPAT